MKSHGKFREHIAGNLSSKELNGSRAGNSNARNQDPKRRIKQIGNYRPTAVKKIKIIDINRLSDFNIIPIDRIIMNETCDAPGVE